MMMSKVGAEPTSATVSPKITLFWILKKIAMPVLFTTVLRFDDSRVSEPSCLEAAPKIFFPELTPEKRVYNF